MEGRVGLLPRQLVIVWLGKLVGDFRFCLLLFFLWGYLQFDQLFRSRSLRFHGDDSYFLTLDSGTTAALPDPSSYGVFAGEGVRWRLWVALQL